MTRSIARSGLAGPIALPQRDRVVAIRHGIRSFAVVNLRA